MPLVRVLERAEAAGSGNSAVGWSPPAGYVIQPGDRIVVLATRAGLSGLLRSRASRAPAAGLPSTSGKRLRMPENGSP